VFNTLRFAASRDVVRGGFQIVVKVESTRRAATRPSVEEHTHVNGR
jgi:hypothetical protein